MEFPIPKYPPILVITEVSELSVLLDTVRLAAKIYASKNIAAPPQNSAVLLVISTLVRMLGCPLVT